MDPKLVLLADPVVVLSAVPDRVGMQAAPLAEAAEPPHWKASARSQVLVAQERVPNRPAEQETVSHLVLCCSPVEGPGQEAILGPAVFR